MAVNHKRSHFGRAGEYYAMSELLLRGWNVAVPVVDVGDDVFVIDDNEKNEKTTFRLQVKTTVPRASAKDSTTLEAKFTISREQLWTGQPIELLYMFVVRRPQSWLRLVIPRTSLHELHRKCLESDDPRLGAPRKTNEQARTDKLSLIVSLDSNGEDPRLWEMSLAEFLDWPEALPELQTGPGSNMRDD